jgi:tetratricopeptide (TPR) repeat protein
MPIKSPEQYQRLPTLPRNLLRALQRTGHVARVSPKERGVGRSTSDLLVLRIAATLQAAGVSPKRILESLAGIRARLPIEKSRPPIDRAVSPITAVDNPKRKAAERHFLEALALEDSDLAAARARYLTALKLHRHHVEARVNLGRLLHLDGQLEQAERVYRAARFSNALLSFNLALLLEDMNREEEAVLAYREALGLDPALHDAHFNLSRLHERAQRQRLALHHLLAYRRLVRHSSPTMNG